MRVGIFGGTFDPPHVGHLLAASDACDTLELDRLIMVPNAQQPLKSGAPAASGDDRLQMVELLCAGDPRFSVDTTEVARGGLSFTVDTLRDIRGRMPDAELYLLIGEDVVETLPSWREWDVVRTLATVVVLTRQAESAEPVGPQAEGLRRIGTRRVDVSASEIRARVRAGRPVTGFVPPAVAAYIRDSRLYRADADPRTPRPILP